MPPVSTARISLPERYRVIRHLANGGMASVWEAHDELLARSVAVKVLAAHLSEDDGGRARFQREARAAAGLSSHPNVVTIYDVGEHDGHVYMVMELMRGGSLADRLRGGIQVPREDALRWLGEAAAGLDAAHEAGVVHRDIKPANLLLDERGRLAIGDFGIARVAETATHQLTVTGQVLGTAAYLSPEQALGEPATAASDRYALGVVAYQLLTGSRPFRADNFAAQARAHVGDEPDPPSARRPLLPRAVDPVLLRALAKDPAARWPTATEMVGRLEDALAGAAPPDATRQMPAGAGGTASARVPAAPATAVAVAARDTGEADDTGDAASGATDTGGTRTPTPAPGMPLPVRRRRFGGMALLAALAAVLLIGGVAAALLSGGGSDGSAARDRAERDRAISADTPAPTATPAKRKRRGAKATPTAQATPAPTATATPTAPPVATATPTPPATTTTTPPAASGTPNLAHARSLQQQGYAAGNRGDYAADLALSQQALAACGSSRQLDPCGYANFEVGRSLNHLGRSAEAIPYLERRLAYGADPTGDAQQELASARAKAGGGGSGGGGSGGGGSDDGGSDDGRPRSGS